MFNEYLKSLTKSLFAIIASRKWGNWFLKKRVKLLKPHALEKISKCSFFQKINTPRGHKKRFPSIFIISSIFKPFDMMVRTKNPKDSPPHHNMSVGDP